MRTMNERDQAAPETGIVAWGPREVARAYDLEGRLDDARRAVHQRFESRYGRARGLRKVVIWLRMWRARYRAEKRVGKKILPPDSLYLLQR